MPNKGDCAAPCATRIEDPERAGRSTSNPRLLVRLRANAAGCRSCFGRAASPFPDETPCRPGVLCRSDFDSADSAACGKIATPQRLLSTHTQNRLNGSSHPFIGGQLLFQPFAAGPGQTIEPDLAIGFGDAPFSRYPAFQQHLLQCRIQ